MSFDGLFDHLEAHGTARFTLTGVKVRSEKDLVLIVKHAGHGNTAWLNAKRKLDAALKARAGAASDEEAIELIAPVFARTVVTGWENANGADGKQLQPTKENVTECLLAIGRKAPDLVSQLVDYAATAANFRDAPEVSAEQLGNG